MPRPLRRPASRRLRSVWRRRRGTPRSSTVVRPTGRRSRRRLRRDGPRRRRPERGCRHFRRSHRWQPSAPSAASLLIAPRILKLPVRWRFSALSTTSPPHRSLKRCRAGRRACESTMPRPASAARSIAALEIVGAGMSTRTVVLMRALADRQRCRRRRRLRRRAVSSARVLVHRVPSREPR